MPKRCTLCRKVSKDGVSLHLFPRSNTEILNRWIVFAESSEFWCRSRLNSETALCSSHFTPECFRKSVRTTGYRRLRIDAIPSILRPTHTDDLHHSTVLSLSHDEDEAIGNYRSSTNDDRSTSVSSEEMDFAVVNNETGEVVMFGKGSHSPKDAESLTDKQLSSDIPPRTWSVSVDQDSEIISEQSQSVGGVLSCHPEVTEEKQQHSPSNARTGTGTLISGHSGTAVFVTLPDNPQGEQDVANIEIRVDDGERNFSENVNRQISPKQVNGDITSNKDYICAVCNQWFPTEKSLTVHQRKHTGERPFSCAVCHRKFVDQSHLKEHMRTHRVSLVYSCQDCHSQLTRRDHQIHHNRGHTIEKLYMCDACDKTMDMSTLLQHRHLRLQSVEGDYRCHVCHLVFSNKDNWLRHEKSHKVSKSHRCDVCGGYFWDKLSLVTHRNTHYTCHVCDSMFPNKQLWLKHEKSHNVMKSYSCDVCGIFFLDNPTLIEHKNTHMTFSYTVLRQLLSEH